MAFWQSDFSLRDAHFVFKLIIVHIYFFFCSRLRRSHQRKDLWHLLNKVGNIKYNVYGVNDGYYVWHSVHKYFTYTIYKWRTPFENGAHKFGLCAIGAQPLNPRIIPDFNSLFLSSRRHIDVFLLFQQSPNFHGLCSFEYHY